VEKILQNGQVEKKEQKEQYTFYDNLTSVEKKIIERLKTKQSIKYPNAIEAVMKQQKVKMKRVARWKRKREKAAKKFEKLKSELKLAERLYEVKESLPENWPNETNAIDSGELRILCPSVNMFKYTGDKRYDYKVEAEKATIVPRVNPAQSEEGVDNGSKLRKAIVKIVDKSEVTPYNPNGNSSLSDSSNDDSSFGDGTGSDEDLWDGPDSDEDLLG